MLEACHMFGSSWRNEIRLDGASTDDRRRDKSVPAKFLSDVGGSWLATGESATEDLPGEQDASKVRLTVRTGTAPSGSSAAGPKP